MPCHSTNHQEQKGHGDRTTPHITVKTTVPVQWRTHTQNPQPLAPWTWNTVPTPMGNLSPQSMCHIAQAVKGKCKGSVFLNTTILQKHGTCDTVLQPCSLCHCVGAAGQGKNAKKTFCRAKKHISKKKQKQRFCMICVTFLSILINGPTGLTTELKIGHFTLCKTLWLRPISTAYGHAYLQ